MFTPLWQSKLDIFLFYQGNNFLTQSCELEEMDPLRVSHTADCKHDKEFLTLSEVNK